MKIDYPKLILLPNMTEGDWANIEMKEWFPGAYVLTPDGFYFSVTFMTPLSLYSQVRDNLEHYSCYSEANIIIIPEMTLERMENAIQTAWQHGLFRVNQSNPFDAVK